MRRGSRGITLIELMIVVAIIGVLAVLGSVGYSRWIRSVKMTEAGEMVSAIRTGQDNYFTQAGKYLDVSAGTTPGNLFPEKNGKKKAAWLDDCTWCTAKDGFRKLGVKADKPVYFGYATMAGDETKDPKVAVCNFKGKAIDWGTPTQGWYVIVAMADSNENGVYASVCTSSLNTHLFTDNEGE